jgi:iron complex outermembrane receptor protein
MNKISMFATVGLAVLAFAPPLAARAATAASAASVDEKGQIGDVIVTATKTGATNLQKTPIAVSVIGGNSLTTNQVVTLRDLPTEVTALKIINNNANTVVYIRGVGGYASNNEQDVGIYQDGVYLGRTTVALNSNFNDLERVEVVKGPQGTVFGRNSVGGALNFISQQPTDTFTMKDTLDIGNYNLIDEALHISGPVMDKVQASAAVSYTKRDGYLEDVVEGVPPLGGENRFSFRGQLKYEFNNDITNLVRVDYMYTHEDYAVNSTLVLPTNDPRFISCGTTAASCVYAGYASPLANAAVGNLKYYGAGAPSISGELDYGINDELNWKINDNLSFKNLVAYRTSENRAFYSSNGTEYFPGATSTLYNQHQFSEEMNLLHTYGNLKGVAGIFLWTEYENQIGDSIKIHAPPVNNGANGSESYQDTRFPTQSYAGFINETYQITPDIGLIGGARVTQEHKVLDTFNTSYVWTGGVPAGWYGYNPANPGARGATSASSIVKNIDGSINQLASVTFPFILGYGTSIPDAVQNVTAFTPKLGIQWQATPNAFLYFSATRGFKSGGFNFTARNTFGDSYLPEWITTYEVGAKTDWLDKRLRVDVALFRNDWTNLQVSQSINLPGLLTPVQQSSNAAAARSTGLDADITFKPWDEWTFTSSVTWLPDAVYLNYTTGQASGYIKNLLIQRGDPRENAGFNTYNASGNRLNNAPDLSANFTAQKDFDLGNGNTAFIRGEAAYTGNTYFDISDDPISRRNPFTLINGSVGWSSPGGHYQVELWGRNIANKWYFNTIGVGNLPIGVVGEPRTFGLKLNYTY